MNILSLNNLKTSPGAKTKSRRVGRGNASGKGNYSGRGMKGQRARSGGKNKLAQKGLRGFLLRIPKSRGFNREKKPIAIVNLRSLVELVKENQEITPKLLFQRKLIKEPYLKVKILGQGKIEKKITVKVHYISQSAKEQILKAGGKVELISSKNN